MGGMLLEQSFIFAAIDAVWIAGGFNGDDPHQHTCSRRNGSVSYAHDGEGMPVDLLAVLKRVFKISLAPCTTNGCVSPFTLN